MQPLKAGADRRVPEPLCRSTRRARGPRSGAVRLLDLYSTPLFLKLLSAQLVYDPRVAKEPAALFTGYVRRMLEREMEPAVPERCRHDGTRPRANLDATGVTPMIYPLVGRSLPGCRPSPTRCSSVSKAATAIRSEFLSMKPAHA